MDELGSHLEQGAEVFHEQHEVHRINGGGFEIEVQIKPFGIFVDCMNEQGANADGLGGLGDSHERVEQQCSPQTLALLQAIDRQPAQESNAHRVIGETFGHSRRGIIAPDATGGQRVITDNDIVAAMRDIDLGGVGLLVLPSEPLQPFIQ